MLLAIDIGNSSVKLGIFDRETLVSRFYFQTARDLSAEEIYERTREKLTGEFSAVVVSSVVPQINESFRNFSEKFLKQTPIFVSNTLDLGLRIKYDAPEALGTDRLINAFAAARKYGKPVIVCSFGTATTIDAVNGENEFLGGIIAPGINTLSEALYQNTAKLPRVSLEKPQSVFGNSTALSIQAGIFYGYLGLVEGILNRMFAELKTKPRVVATGGFAALIGENTDSIETIDENLMLDGLRMIYWLRDEGRGIRDEWQ